MAERTPNDGKRSELRRNKSEQPAEMPRAIRDKDSRCFHFVMGWRKKLSQSIHKNITPQQTVKMPTELEEVSVSGLATRAHKLTPLAAR